MDAAQQTGQAAGNLAQLPMREKLWTERSDTEKLEALRQQVVTLTHQLGSALETVHALRRHQHDGKGALMVPLEDDFNKPYRGRIPTALSNRE